MRRAAMVMGVMVVWILAAVSGADDTAGQFTELEGKVTVQKTNGQSIQAVLGSRVVQGDVVMTDREAKATILFGNGSVVKLGPSTTLTINRLEYDKDKGSAKSIYDLAAGTIMNIVSTIFGEEDSEYLINTPTSVSGVRGSINIIKTGIHPRTGRNTTLGVSINGTTFLRGHNESGQGCLLPAGTYGMVDDATGACTFLGQISNQDLQELLDSFDLRTWSLDERALGLRGGLGSNLSIGGDRWFQVPDFLEPMGGGPLGGDDPEDLLQNFDNPSNFITFEPSQLVELIITISQP